MTSRVFILAALSLTFPAVAGSAERGSRKSADEADVVFRKPFTLRIRVDQEHYYEENKDKVPYVYRGAVYLFIGDRFGLKIDVVDSAVRAIRYERDLSKADVTLEFKEGGLVNGKATSLLVMQNHTKHTFLMDAAMTVPDRKDIL